MQFNMDRRIRLIDMIAYWTSHFLRPASSASKFL